MKAEKLTSAHIAAVVEITRNVETPIRQDADGNYWFCAKCVTLCEDRARAEQHCAEVPSLAGYYWARVKPEVGGAWELVFLAPPDPPHRLLGSRPQSYEVWMIGKMEPVERESFVAWVGPIEKPTW